MAVLPPADRRANSALGHAFREMTGDVAGRPATLTVMGRKLAVPLAAEGVARYDFATLCGTALGAGDYLALATNFHTLILDGIPLQATRRMSDFLISSPEADQPESICGRPPLGKGKLRDRRGA